MARIFRQVALRPGTFPTPLGGRFRLTADKIKRYVAGTQAMLAAGHRPIVFLEHPPLGSPEGAPVQFEASAKTVHDLKAARLRNAVGHLVDASVDDFGNLSYGLQIADDDIARKVDSGLIRFTSPELRENFRDGRGKEFGPVIAHVALVATPRDVSQGGIAASQFSAPAAFQFSLEDWQPMDADTLTEEPEADITENLPPEPEDNPDAPADPEGGQQFAAVLEQLREQCDIDLPADCSPATFVRDLLTALKTLAKLKSKAVPEGPEPDDLPGSGDMMSEESPRQQFSLEDVQAGRAPKLLARVMQAEDSRLRQQLSALPKAARDAVREAVGALQFSADGEVLNALPLSKVLGIMRRCLPNPKALGRGEGETGDATAEQFAAPDHPAGGDWLDKPGRELSPEEVAANVEQFSKRHPGLYR